MKKALLIGAIIVTLILGIVGFTYAWFSAIIEGNESAKDIIVDADQIKLIYTDTTPLALNKSKPGDSVTKTFTVENTGSSATEYQIKWKDLINEFKAGELKISLTCISKDSNDNVTGTCESIEDKMVPYTETQNDYKIKDNIEIDPNIIHEYTLTLEFIEKNKNQNYNQGSHFEGKINITEATLKPVNNCIFDGSLTPGAEYTNGQYTYRYMQEGVDSSHWQNITRDGWGVILTDKNSTDAVTTPLCTSINGKPIVSMSYMFYESKATTLDLSSFDTSNVTNMSIMFASSNATTLDLSGFDTSKVTDMSYMFGSQATTIDLSSFDTSNVTNMEGMFSYSDATTINLSSFDTSKVTNMKYMFWNSQATTLDLSSFDTSNVTSMLQMFYYSEATQIIGLDKFNTSKVTNMQNMFAYSQVTSIDLSGFDTSNVTNMQSMFDSSQATTINLSNFDTSKVTDMNNMFTLSKATTLDLSSFDTSNVIDMSWMFALSQATILDLSSFDTSNVTDMNNMFWNSEATTIYVSDKWNSSNVINSTAMFADVTNLVGAEGTTYNSSNPMDKTYAHVDEGVSNPGYFTYKAN